MANWLALLAHDLRHALRTLERRKAFTLTGVASLALPHLGTGRLVRGLLYGLEPADPVALVGTAAVLLAVAAAACLGAARGALGVDPASALRSE